MFPEKYFSALFISAVIGAVAVCGRSGRGASPRSRPLGSSTDGDRRELIWNGNPAAVGRYPYTALLSGDDSMCGGSLIASNLVLSAAHCGESFQEVRVGVTDRTEPDDLEETVDIKKVVVHPDYGGIAGDLENDLMILVLSRNIDTITPVCLAEADMYLPPRNPLRITGWGYTESDNLYSDVLRESGEVFYIPNNDCREIKFNNITRPLFDTIDSESYMCAATHRKPNTNSCLGDGGGPLLIKGDASDDDVQVGITSFGFDCEVAVGVYARISTQRDWIDRVALLAGGSLRQNCPTPTPPSKSPTEEPTTPPTGGPTPQSTDGVTPRMTENRESNFTWSTPAAKATARSAAVAATEGSVGGADAAAASSSGAGHMTAVPVAVLAAAACLAGLR